MTSSTSTIRMTAALGLGGPILLGATLGIPFGLGCVFKQAATVPAALVGVGALMIPALYIVTSLIGVAPPAQQVVRAATSALRSSGTIMLGLAPATVFLMATSRTELAALILGMLIAGVSMFAAFRGLFSDLFACSGVRPRAVPVFLLWSGVSLGLGAHLFIGALHHDQPVATETTVNATEGGTEP